MKHTAFAVRMPRTVAMVTTLALLAWTLGLPAWIHSAQAANVEDFSNTLSDSDLGAYSTSTITWTTTNGMTDGQRFTLSFVDADANGSNFSLANVEQDDLVNNEVGFTALAGACGAVTPGQIGLTVYDTTTIVGEACGTIASSTTLTLSISGGAQADQARNPLIAGSYVVRLAGTSSTPIPDTGDTRVYIIDDVTVTATVETNFTFSINAVNAGVAVNGETEVTVATSTATTVPFGVIPTNDAVVMAQELRVDTNALNGFSVTVEADQTLTSGNGATIDEFDNGTPVAVPTPWAGPDGTMGATDTYGHWGLTTDDPTLASAAVFDADDYVGNFVGNPVEVFYHGTAVEQAAGQGQGTTTVAYRVDIMELQEAANDYTATLTYVATPVF